MNIAETIKALDFNRKELSSAQDSYNKAKAEFEASVIDLTSTIKGHKERVLDYEEQLRELAIEAFDGENKKPFPGVGIQVSKGVKLDYDEIKALTWCVNHNVFLTIDKAAFERYAEVMNDQSLKDIVTKTPTETVKATIDKDLSRAVEAMREIA